MDHYQQHDDEGKPISNNDESERNEDAVIEAASPADQLERCGEWLSSISRDDVIALRETAEYQDFLCAFERLGHAHRRVIALDRGSVVGTEEGDRRMGQEPEFLSNGGSPSVSHVTNYLQHVSADDVVFRVLEFLECQSLMRMALTCNRFRQLVYRSAAQRTYEVANTRQLNNVMQLLRAKEQIDGVRVGIDDSHVRVPILLLRRRVLVTNAGDPEINGIYFCTGSNGNGYVFTKPRYPEQRLERKILTSDEPTSTLPSATGTNPNMDPAPAARNINDNMLGALPVNQSPNFQFDTEAAQPGQLLRCFIAKRFSNDVSYA